MLRVMDLAVAIALPDDAALLTALSIGYRHKQSLISNHQPWLIVKGFERRRKGQPGAFEPRPEFVGNRLPGNAFGLSRPPHGGGSRWWNARLEVEPAGKNGWNGALQPELGGVTVAFDEENPFIRARGAFG